MKPKLTLIEIPEVKVACEVDGFENIFSTIRTNYPKQSQLIVASLLSDLVDIEIIDMKTLSSEHEDLYKNL